MANNTMISLNSGGISAQTAHVVMLAQYLPLHFVSTMQRLAKKVGRLTLLLSEEMDSSRDWTADFSGLEVQVQKSVRMGVKHRHPLGFKDSGSFIVPYSTIPDLRALHPDVVISVEVGPRTLQAALLRSLGATFKLIVQVRESESTAQSRGRVRRALRRTLLPRVDDVFVNGASGKLHVLSCGVAADHISVVPSGTDTSLFGKQGQSSSPHYELRLLYVGQLIQRKGLVPFATALAVAARTTVRPICWTIAGRGPEEAALRDIAWPENVRLEFLGSQPYRDLPHLYSQSDVFVMPSLSDEWGLVVNEAMASWLPVLGCTGAQAVEELVEDGESGWTYPPATPDRLAVALESVLGASETTLAEMGVQAHRRAMRMSDESTADAMFRGIEKVLHSPAETMAA